MNLVKKARQWAPLVALLLSLGHPAFAQQAPPSGDRLTTVVGTVRDERNAIALPGVTVEVVGTKNFAVTDVDGRYRLPLAPGTHELQVLMDGYERRTVKLTVGNERTVEVDVPLSMSSFSEEVTVTAETIDAETSSAAAQLVERKNAQVITDNMGAQEMRANGDSDAAAAMQRVTGLSLVDNQYKSSCGASVSATATRRWPVRSSRRPSPTRRSCRWTSSRPG